MRPFSTLGVNPFLFATEKDLSTLQSEFHKRSRQYHPDRFLRASDEEKQEAEARSAQLNADYSQLKDPWELINSVIESDSMPAAAKSGPPPDLAADYFELQETLEERPQEAVKALEDFLKLVSDKRVAGEEKIMTEAQRFPFSGLGEAPAPWSASDLDRLRAAVVQLRYYKSFENDILRRLNTLRARSN